MLPPLSALRVDCCIGKRRAPAATSAAWFVDLDANNDANPEYSWEALMEENDPITLTPLNTTLKDDLDDPPTIVSPLGTLMRRSSYEALLASGSEFDPITRAPLYPAEGDFRGTAMVAVIEEDETTGEKRFKRARTVNEHGKTIERIVFEPYRPPLPSEPEYIERLWHPALKLHYETRRRLGELLEAWYAEAAKLMCAKDDDWLLQNAFPSGTLDELFRQLVPRGFPQKVPKATDVDEFETIIVRRTMMVRRTHMNQGVEESLRFLCEMFTNCTEVTTPSSVPVEPWSRRDPKGRRVLDPVTAFGKAVYVTQYSLDTCLHMFENACYGLVYIKAVYLSQAELTDPKVIWKARHVGAALVALAKALSFSMHHALLQDYAATYAAKPPAVFDVSSDDSAVSKLLHDLCTWDPSDDVRNSPGSKHPWVVHVNAFLDPIQRFRNAERAAKLLGRKAPARRLVLQQREWFAEQLGLTLSQKLVELGGFLRSYYAAREALLKLEQLYAGMFTTRSSLRELEQLPLPRRAGYLDWGMKSEGYADAWRTYYRTFGPRSTAPGGAFSSHGIVTASWKRIIEATEIMMDLALCHRECIEATISHQSADVFETPESPHPFAWRWRFYDEPEDAMVPFLPADAQIVNPGDGRRVEGFARRAESVASRAGRKLFEMQNAHNIARTSTNDAAKEEARHRHEDFETLVKFAHEVTSYHPLFDHRAIVLSRPTYGNVPDEDNTLEDMLVAHFQRVFESLEDRLESSPLHSKEAAGFLLYFVNQVQSAHARLVGRVKHVAVMEAVKMSGGASGPAAPVLQRLTSELRERNLWELLEEPSVKEETMALIAADAGRRIRRFARDCNRIKISINEE